MLELDAREVLAHLNAMGYHQVTAEQLKEFMKDLRKLIKYEEKLCPPQDNVEQKTNARFDKLHKTATISFQCKKVINEEGKESKKMPPPAKPERSKSARNREPAYKSPNKENRVRKPEPRKGHREQTSARTSTPMWIRPRSCSPAVTRNKDPVQLYQFYKKEWDKFKNYLPGENDRAELRWKIRHKLLGASNQ